MLDIFDTQRATADEDDGPFKVRGKVNSLETVFAARAALDNSPCRHDAPRIGTSII